MRKTILLFWFISATFVFSLIPHQVAFTEEHGGDIRFEDTKRLGPVIFSHDKHLEAGNKCEDCHDQVFQKKKGSTDKDNALTMKVLRKGKYCGTCHNGKKSFAVSRSCKKCHLKVKKQ